MRMLMIVLFVALILTPGVVFASKHHSHSKGQPSQPPATTTPPKSNMICTVTTTPGNQTITLTGGLPADASCPVIQSGVHVLYMHWYYSPGWLNLRGAFQTNSNEIDISTVLYDNNHQVMNTPPKYYIPLTTNGNGIKSFDAPITSTDELVGAATYQLQCVFVPAGLETVR